ncbi:hypothetical protein SAMN05660484_02209 [Eubacterium ruminantium]|uniref:Uncharacterized protein n=1 Tax=Eubacterium ruminantium TaxID=42322 RepID=A0A1T4Q5G5_9FIRM|nr:hypothetical protein [Eubacterium ruminantium]SCW63948.1 hypothetical protein SAMN05660484_02209 [Eubacterium ruminantium]SDN31554.1 hypothetical protein SAMN04490370_11661 [Eubacterium ruminantium]SJZ99035.1 hypothetical protein SAMN02745110_02274 [Eubacterium ruminantium]
MERFFKLNKPVYYNSDAIRVSDEYDKRNGGYVINCEVVELTRTYDDSGWLYGKVFCPEYYNMGGDGYTMIAESSRRNAKKAMIAKEEVGENARKYAENYIRNIADDLEIIEEVF